MAKCGKVDYSKSMIYKLCCKNPEIKEIYVGSTTNLIKRKYNHKSDCYNVNSNNYNLYKYQFIRENGGFKNWDMVLIENYDCENKQELHKRERYYIELLNATLNSRKSYITEEEKKEYNKEWIENHKEEKKEYNKEWIENHKDYQKNYKENNKQQLKEYNKKYYLKNKEKLEQYYLKQKQKRLDLEQLKLYFNILKQNKKFNL